MFQHRNISNNMTFTLSKRRKKKILARTAEGDLGNTFSFPKVSDISISVRHIGARTIKAQVNFEVFLQSKYINTI